MQVCQHDLEHAFVKELGDTRQLSEQYFLEVRNARALRLTLQVLDPSLYEVTLLEQVLNRLCVELRILVHCKLRGHFVNDAFAEHFDVCYHLKQHASLAFLRFGKFMLRKRVSLSFTEEDGVPCTVLVLRDRVNEGLSN